MCSSLKEYLTENQIEIVKKAYRIGAEAHDGQRRKSGENYINHPLAVACILADLHLDCSTIVAAILHDTLEDTELTESRLTAEFGTEVAALVNGVSKVSKTEFNSEKDYEVENIRRLFSAMSKDIRVVLIKLADRIHNLSSLNVHKLEKRKRIVRETQDIYIPIADLFGMYNWRQQMEDLCFRAMYPKRYKTLRKAVRKELGSRVDDIIRKHSKMIRNELADQGIDAEVTGRFKNISSIHNKMKRKGNSLKAVWDLIAFRIIVSSVDNCYRALGVIHRRFKPVPREFSDYIAIPKPNGYESLHTVVHSEMNRAIEVQIRTEEMHRVAEAGIASHLRYKSVPTANHQSVPGLQSLNDLILRLEESETPSEYLKNVRLDLFYDYVHVFKPNGEILRMKKGATVVDFAYAVHTDMGNNIKSATVNGQRVPLNTVLRNGDAVKINSGRSNTKSLDPSWLNFVVTTRARMAIHKALKNRSKKEQQRMGSRLFSKTLKSYKIRASSVTDDAKVKLVEKFNLPDWSALMGKIGSGDLNATITVSQMLRDMSPDSDLDAPNQAPVSIVGTEGTVVNFPKCCNAIPPEPIVGHMVPDRGFVIHHINCPNVRASKSPAEHWVNFDWKNQPTGVFRTAIRVDANDDKGVLAGVTARIASAESNICDCKIDTEQSRDLAILHFDIEVRNRDHLASILRSIKRDKNVFRVSRMLP